MVVSEPASVDPAFRVFVGNMVTGRISCDLPASTVGWGLRLNDAGSIDVTAKALSSHLAAIDVRAVTTPRMQFLGVSYEDTILEAGPIWKRDYKPGTGLLKIGAAGIWSLFDKIKVLNWAQINAGTPVPRSVIDLNSLSYGSIARELVRLCISGNPANPGLPIVLPPVISGTNERHYKGYELGWLGERLRNLTKVQDGPDLRFQPRFNGADPTRVEWVMQHGTDADPLLYQTGSDWIWDATVAESGVSDIGTKDDSTEMADRVWQPGAGSELAMKLATAQDATLLAAGFPWTEADAASKDVEDTAILQSYANAALAAARRPVETWSIEVRAGNDPKLGSYLPGEFATINIPDGNPMIEAGQRRVRIMAIDGDGSQTVKLTPAPMPGGV